MDDGLTMGEIFRMILKRIWYILGASVACALIAALIVYFAINPSARYYSEGFDLVFPAGKEQVYPDGEQFYYRNIISRSCLDEAILAEGLGKIDVADMDRSDEIEIAAETTQSAGVTVYTGHYTVRVKASYFSGAKQAEAFIRSLAQVTVSRIRANAEELDYSISSETFDDAPFEERLELLAQERADMLARYDAWIEAYDASYMVDTGSGKKSLKDLRASVIALYGESAQADYESELALRGYHFGDLETYKTKLKLEYEQNKTAIERLKEAGVTQSSPSIVASPAEDGSCGIVMEQKDDLTALIVRNNKILHWLGSSYLGETGGIAATLTDTAITDFASRLEAERQKLQTAAEALKRVTASIYTSGTDVRFDTQKVKTTGGKSTVLIAAAAFIVAFLIASVVVCAVDVRKKRAKKETEKKVTEENTVDKT